MKNPMITELIAEGYLIQDDDESRDTVTLVRPKRRASHVLHLILTLFTGGVWGFVWIGVALTGRSKIVTVQREA